MTSATNNAMLWDRLGCCYDKVSCQLQLQRAEDQRDKIISQHVSAGSLGAVRCARESWKGHVISCLVPCTDHHTRDIMSEGGNTPSVFQTNTPEDWILFWIPLLLASIHPLPPVCCGPQKWVFKENYCSLISFLRTLGSLEEDGFCFLFLI